MPTIKFPHAIESEKSALGAALLDEGAATLVLSSLSDADFSDGGSEANLLVFRSMRRVRDSGKAVDAKTVADDMGAAKTLDDAGGPEYLLELGNSPISAASVADYVAIVKEQTRLRAFLKSAGEMIQDFSSKKAIDAKSFVSDWSARIADSAAKGIQRRFAGSSEVAESTVARAEAMMASGKAGLTGIDTGYKMLNEITHGWQGGKLYVIAGRPSMGKSAFAANVAYNAAKSGKSVLFISLEMPSDDVMSRIMSKDSGVLCDRIANGTLTDKELGLLKRSRDSVSKLDIRMMDDDCSGELSDVVSMIQGEKYADPSLGMVVIDYIGLMSNPGAENRQNEVSQITRALKRLSRSADMPILALCQLNRDADEGTGSLPTLSMLRESGAIEQDADVVMLLHRKTYYEARKDGSDEPVSSDENVIVAKNRSGRLGTAVLVFNKSIQSFDNPASRFEASIGKQKEKAAVDGSEE